MEYKVPTSGIYTVSAQVHRAIPIGEVKHIPNPDRLWWQFWKPTHIWHQEWRTEVVDCGIEYKRCKEGDIISSSILPIRIGGIPKETQE
jgi:hypothetical protein